MAMLPVLDEDAEMLSIFFSELGPNQGSVSHGGFQGMATRLVMSNKRFLEIVCFRFPTNVLKKIEYIRF
jgi:hypothetical protein